VIRKAFFALAVLSATADAQNVLTLNWSLSAGPSTATPSGRTTRLPASKTCFSCKKTDELVTGADVGKFHVAFRATGKPNNLGLAVSMEGMFNHATSEPYDPPPPTCTRYSCEQKRQALVDNAIILGAGLDYSPLSAKRVSPYLAVTGGLSLNSVAWSEDSTLNNDLSGKATQFGPYVAAGAGVRVRIKKWISAFAEWRYYATLVTPGSTMRPLSFGIVLHTRLSDDTEY
jgi:hypothetical protein